MWLVRNGCGRITLSVQSRYGRVAARRLQAVAEGAGGVIFQAALPWRHFPDGRLYPKQSFVATRIFNNFKPRAAHRAVLPGALAPRAEPCRLLKDGRLYWPSSSCRGWSSWPPSFWPSKQALRLPPAFPSGLGKWWRPLHLAQRLIDCGRHLSSLRARAQRPEHRPRPASAESKCKEQESGPSGVG